ncbi:THUMP domain-containing protein [Halococcoides cellulosivorans]|uniref:tRNA (guanine(10)-N(2))-dimethyltransferase n=1 Tax=Halococcoides cellulosivorans TaxID=1679096 RepID=A0A2R4WY88_9EURY|nr:THUMP domain-containing protein [Halococcoides cellulosivorans]AWB26507.1 TIGR01177 family methyltransferase [Halococcoides cellulosivorans]
MYLLELVGTDDALAAQEAGTRASGVERIAPALAVATGIDDRVGDLALTHRVGDLLARTDASLDAVLAALTDASIDREGSVAVRARTVRETAIDTQRVERRLGALLVERGFTVDLDSPDHELRAVFSGECGALAWLTHDLDRSVADRAPTDRPFFRPGCMAPTLARALVNLAGARPGRTILDPMCGTGGHLAEARRVGARAIGIDVERAMAAGAAQNLAAVDDDGWLVARGDATALPVGAVEGCVVDVPYGRQTKVASRDVETLVEAALAELRRVTGRVVLVGDRPYVDLARATGWTVSVHVERRVHRSLDRHIHVLDRA